MGMTSPELPDGRAPGYRRAIQLQPEVPSWMAHVSKVLNLLTFNREGPSLALGRLLLLGLLLGNHLTLIEHFFLLHFLLLVGHGEQVNCRRRKGGAGRG